MVGEATSPLSPRINQASPERILKLKSIGCSSLFQEFPSTIVDAFPIKTENEQMPDRIYNIETYSSNLHWTNLKTGVDGTCSINHSFQTASILCEVQGGPLIITGGKGEVNAVLNDVLSVDVRRDFAVTTKHPMISSRMAHASVYCDPYVYVLAGCNNGGLMRECERYFASEDNWEVIPSLPRKCSNMGAVASQSTILVLGGEIFFERYIDLVQELNLVTLSWRILPVNLPKPSACIVCFRVKEVYFVIDKKLFTLSDQVVKQVKELTNDLYSYFGPSYYSNGTIYASEYEGPVQKLEIGRLA